LVSVSGTGWRPAVLGKEADASEGRFLEIWPIWPITRNCGASSPASVGVDQPLRSVDIGSSNSKARCIRNYPA
jgi:hypothetical protein